MTVKQGKNNYLSRTMNVRDLIRYPYLTQDFYKQIEHEAFYLILSIVPLNFLLCMS